MSQDSRHAAVAAASAPASRSPSAEKPTDPTALYDSSLRLALGLIKAQDWGQLAARTGIDRASPDQQYLRLFLEFIPVKARKKASKVLDMSLLPQFELLAPSAYAEESRINAALRTVPARIALMPGDPSRTIKGTSLEKLLQEIGRSKIFTRLRMAVPHGQCLERSLEAIDLPPGDVFNGHLLGGRNIVIGVIDDGCAFAHPDFLKITGKGKRRRYRTRVLALWDQAQTATTDDKGNGWQDVADFGFGREIFKDELDAAIKKHASAIKVREDDVYAEVRYEVGSADERATHGTQVMGIAAGNGNSVMGWRGVARNADIIFVQLPPNAVSQTPKLLSDDIVQGVEYIFKRARELKKKAAVVNISYGGYRGPHDGTSAWETAIDELLNVRNRSVVVSAGNGFEADCHATGALLPGQERRLGWIVMPEDRTPNEIEVWYNGDAALTLWLTTPDGAQEFGPFPFCAATDLARASDGKVIGSIEHVQGDPNNGDNSAAVALRQTTADLPDPMNPLPTFAPAAPGTWSLRLRNTGAVAAEFHAWIQRDDVTKPGGPRMQSRFVRGDAYPGCTIGDFAAGRLTISAGAFNAATDEVCGYSACGPTRSSKNNPARKKPEVCAPGEELATGAGVLSTGSRRAAPRRMNGTSAAAPHVAGIVALGFDYRRNHQKKNLTAAKLRACLAAQVGSAPLVADRRQAIDGRRPVKQGDLWADLIGAGKVSCNETLVKIKNLP